MNREKQETQAPFLPRSVLFKHLKILLKNLFEEYLERQNRHLNLAIICEQLP